MATESYVRGKRGPYRKYDALPGNSQPKTTRWRTNRHKSCDDRRPTDDAVECSEDTVTFDFEQFESIEAEQNENEMTDMCEGFADDEEVNLDRDSDADETPELSHSSASTKSEPLYTGARITQVVSMILIITFVMRHQLTGEALKDLLVLLELHCLTPNLCKRSVHLFNGFFTQLSSPVQTHYFCDFCHTYHGTTNRETCPVCQKSRQAHFMYIPVVAQVQSVLSRLGYEILQHRSKRQKQLDDNIEDVYDGKVYIEHFENNHFRGTPTERRETEIHISFQLNTDGVAIFKCSNFTVWPCYLTINELPPKQRFSSENRIFAGLWYGKTKPDVNVFFTPLATELTDLYQNGMDIQVGCRTMTLRALLISLVCDAPARCIVQNFVQFNGYFGCSCCLAKGASVKTSEKGQMMSYPYDISSFETGHAQLRSHPETMQLAKDAETTGRNQQGVKGYSIMYSFTNFDIIRGVTIDYMHCVLLGVVKMLLHLWTDSANKKQKFYIGDFVNIISSRMKKLTPPNVITRIPRSMDDLKLWKASEYKSFLLFHAYPCLVGILPEEHLSHFMLLSQGIFLLNKESISKGDISMARLLIQKFCASVDCLYAPRNETSNVHALLHLVDKVENLGPLWAQSCFFYEDLNGDLRAMFHGSQKVDLQISLAVIIQQQVPLLVSEISIGSEADLFYRQLKGRAYSRNCIEIDKDIFAVGTLVSCNLSNDIKNKVEAILEPDTHGSAYQFKRLLSRGVMYHSKAYTRVSRRNSYTVQFSVKKVQHIGHVQCYLQLSDRDEKLCYVAVIKVLNKIPLESGMPSHIINVVLSDDTIIVPVSRIMRMCVFMSVSDSEKNCVANLPNIFESD